MFPFISLLRGQSLYPKWMGALTG